MLLVVVHLARQIRLPSHLQQASLSQTSLSHPLEVKNGKRNNYKTANKFKTKHCYLYLTFYPSALNIAEVQKKNK